MRGSAAPFFILTRLPTLASEIQEDYSVKSREAPLQILCLYIFLGGKLTS
jgi:hypothetical protein